MPYLNFRAERDRDSTSWRRPLEEPVMIERRGPTDYVVTVGGGSVHHVHYGLERGGRVGYCDCEGWEYRDEPGSPCAHLCALRQADFIGDLDVRGRAIEPVDTLAETTAVRADGGVE